VRKKTKIRIVREEFGTKPIREAFEEAFAPYFQPKPMYESERMVKEAAGQ